METPTPRTRRQLTLFVPPSAAAELEALRQVLDPIQHSLIAAHATLCREDEFGPTIEPELARRFAETQPRPLTLHFGAPQAFQGHGILLPCVNGVEAFHRLRVQILGSSQIRAHPPHITLAHPRNPKAPGNTLPTTQRLPDPLVITFTSVSLIEQTEADAWREVARYDLPES